MGAPGEPAATRRSRVAREVTVAAVTPARKKRPGLTRASRRARAAVKSARASARPAAVPEKLRRILASRKTTYHKTSDHLTCPYCGEKRASERHVDRCREAALVPILAARAISAAPAGRPGILGRQEDED